MKRFTSLTLALIVSLNLIGCGTAKFEDANYYTESTAYDMPYEMEESAESSAVVMKELSDSTESAEVVSGRKLIKRISLNVETKDFDNLMDALDEDIAKAGGYVESADLSYGSIYSYYKPAKYSTIVVRIPVDKLDDFVGSVSSRANVTYKSENVEDVTLSYVDIDSHKNMLLEEQKRLLELMDEAETIEDIISLENSLTDVRYQLESMESQLRTYDNLIEYSTVTISVSEVVSYSDSADDEKSTFERMRDGFKDSLKGVGEGIIDFAIGFIINLPYIVLYAVIIVVIIIVIRLIVKGIKKKKASKEVNKEDE